ncbi:cyclin [Trichodelitschia bisporula]|uniref:Cyclin n=1 Tax=Trichodelitschia bisporula TaxID=703511 RepID=A0A6G1HYM2_9PEZI|nr:cyclin [Trichodelitschia bisporula]
MSRSTPTMASNKAALDYFISLPVSKEMISHLAGVASQVIRCETPSAPVKNGQLITPPDSPSQGPASPALPSVEAFITSLVEKSHVQVPTLMSSLVYLARLKARLPPVAKGMRCTVHRIFLASLILAAKNLNDSSPKNKHWARYTNMRGFGSFGFSITEVNLMEKQMLFLLDWDLRIRPDDLYTHLEPFLAPIRSYFADQERIRAARQRKIEMEEFAHQAALAEEKQHYAPSQRTVRMNSVASSARTPSLSPPSRSSSSNSTSPDIDSLNEPFEPANMAPEPMYIHNYDNESGAVVVHFEPLVPMTKTPHHRLPVYDEKPAKKARIGPVGGGFLSRFLGGQTRTAV